MALVPVERPFVRAGEALERALTALRAAQPILDGLRPEPGQAPDHEVTRAAQLVEDAITQAEGAR